MTLCFQCDVCLSLHRTADAAGRCERRHEPHREPEDIQVERARVPVIAGYAAHWGTALNLNGQHVRMSSIEVALQVIDRLLKPL